MQVQDIDIAKIVVPEVRITASYDEELAGNLRDSLAHVGQIEPITVVTEGESYVLVDGLHRTQEAKARGDTTIPAVVREGTAREALLLNLAMSHNKGKTPPGEILAVIKELLEKESMDSDEISRAVGMSRDQVERFWRIAESSPLLQMALQEGTVSLGAAYQISRLPRFEQQEEVLAVQVLYKRPIAALKVLVDETLKVMENPPEVLAPVEVPPPPPPTCGGCQRETESRHLAAVPLCPTCYGQVYRLAQARAAAPAEPAPEAAGS